MKKILLFLVVAAFAACSGPAKEAQEASADYTYYGDTITAEEAVPAPQLYAMMEGNEQLSVKLSGTIEECCQKKGCWMKVDMGDGKTMRVSFKDYAFFVPMNSAGKEVIMEGVATMEETSVESLRHFAEDAGKSKEEIAAITASKKELVFEASGVILK
jgi:hypothetical protein